MVWKMFCLIWKALESVKHAQKNVQFDLKRVQYDAKMVWIMDFYCDGSICEKFSDHFLQQIQERTSSTRLASREYIQHDREGAQVCCRGFLMIVEQFFLNITLSSILFRTFDTTELLRPSMEGASDGVSLFHELHVHMLLYGESGRVVDLGRAETAFRILTALLCPRGSPVSNRMLLR